jgi:uracil-DNA glycosylase family 4
MGFASQPTSVARGDGLRLSRCYVAALARCAPPANKPTPTEIGRCREYLLREWALLTEVRAVLALGKIAMDGFLSALRSIGRVPSRPALQFGHGASHDLGANLMLFASYHPSQQNTFTGKLTPAGFDAVLRRVRRHVDSTGSGRVA